jgi:glycogen synthase
MPPAREAQGRGLSSTGLRILTVAHAFPPQVGGVETHLWDISRHLGKRGHRVLCLVGGPEVSESHGPVAVVRHPALTVGHLLAQRGSLARHLRNDKLAATLSRIIEVTSSEFGPDIIHAHNLLHFAPELAEALVAKAEGKPIVTSVHDRVGEHLFPEVTRLPWAHTLFASHYLQANLPRCRPSSVRWLGIELDRFSRHGHSDSRFAGMERPVVFHPARLLRWKGVEIGLEAFGIVRRRLGRGTLVLCASGNAATDHLEISALRDDLTRRAEEMNLGDHLRFLEFAQTEMPAAYRASDLVWYPTIDEEPLGLVPIEAMACGIPLIVSDSGGMRETVLHDRTGLVVPKGDAAALSAAAERLLRDAALRNRLVENGLSQARKFNNDDYVDDLLALYQGVLTTGKSPQVGL